MQASVLPFKKNIIKYKQKSFQKLYRLVYTTLKLLKLMFEISIEDVFRVE